MQNENTTVSVAFLDVLSSGLGATIILFVIFAVLDAPGDRRSTTPEGLDLQQVSVRAEPPNPGQPLPRPAVFRLLVARETLGTGVPPYEDMLKAGEQEANAGSFTLGRAPDQGHRQVYLLMLHDTTPEQESPVRLTATQSVRVSFEHAGGYTWEQAPLKVSEDGTIGLKNNNFASRGG